MKKLYEDKNILVELDEISGSIFITNKKSENQMNYIRIKAFGDGHLDIRASHSRFHPILDGFNIWLN